MSAPIVLTDDQFTTFSIKDRLNEIDVLLDNGAIPISGWQELHAERDALNELVWEAHGVFNISDEDGELIFTNEKFASRVNVSDALGTITVDGQTFYVTFISE